MPCQEERPALAQHGLYNYYNQPFHDAERPLHYYSFLRDYVSQSSEGQPRLGRYPKGIIVWWSRGRGQNVTRRTAVGRSLFGGSLPLLDGSQSVPHQKKKKMRIVSSGFNKNLTLRQMMSYTSATHDINLLLRH